MGNRVKYFSCLIFSVVLVVSSYAYADVKTENVGGCFILHVREGKGKSPDITKFCKSLVNYARSADGIRLHDRYGWSPPYLATSFDMAEKAVSAGKNSPGFITGITGNRPTRIIIVPGSEDARINESFVY